MSEFILFKHTGRSCWYISVMTDLQNTKQNQSNWSKTGIHFVAFVDFWFCVYPQVSHSLFPSPSFYPTLTILNLPLSPVQDRAALHDQQALLWAERRWRGSGGGEEWARYSPWARPWTVYREANLPQQVTFISSNNAVAVLIFLIVYLFYPGVVSSDFTAADPTVSWLSVML